MKHNKAEYKTMKLTTYTNNELLEHLLYGYSLLELMIGDIEIRSILNKQITPQESAFRWMNRDYYLNRNPYATFDKYAYADV